MTRAGDHPVYDVGASLCPAADCTWALLRRDTVHVDDAPDLRAVAWPAIVGGVLDHRGPST